ncbi:calcineurin-like phosphoesterase family protein [Methylocapsa sp. S129]|uniref:calcineurin-like phosphoesterase C-terminal domain-containing protein n=1 Tax=Methylocapsa sp. S129 TaxID=1641869 RepID=UPI00131CFB8F|nr:calcineurin-like phosphoesterase family protein [Methylocapsa sp. S129]
MTTEQQANGVTRRDVLLGAAGAAAAALAPAGAAQAQGAAVSEIIHIAGTVFEDRNGSGKPGDGNPAIAGVLVSNGEDVSVTDSEGRYSLSLRDDAAICVIKPSGYMPPVDPATQLPRFYRLHQPKGSPAELNLTFAGIAPTDPLPASLDFALKRQDEPKKFEVVLFTDPQPESEVEVDFIREDVIEALNGTPAKFGITAGDVMFDDLSLYGRYNFIIGTIGIPWWNIGGNHDLNFEAPDRHYSRETFKRVFGPNYYAFSYADALFLMLDDVDYLGADPTKPHDAGKYEGRLDAPQLAFIKNVLAQTPADKLIVMVLHIPLRNYLDSEPGTNLQNLKELFALFEGRRFTVSFSGHTHTTEHHYFDAADGWTGAEPHHHHVMTAVSGSWWSGPFDHRGVACADSRDGSPNGFHILSIDGNSYKTRFVPAKEPNGRQMRLSIDSRFHSAQKEVQREFRQGQLLGSPIAYAAVAATSLIANVFDGGPKTKVAMRIGDRAPIAMARQTMPDPFVEEVFARNEATKKSWIKAEPSSHMWTARLPADLTPGTHRIIVEAITEYGDAVNGRIALEIVG